MTEAEGMQEAQAAKPGWELEPAGPMPSLFGELRDAFWLWPQWLVPAWHKITVRYRQTMVGPLWITAGLGMIIALKTLLFSGVLGSAATYMPYVAFGMIFWQTLSGLIAAGVGAFSSVRNQLMEGALPVPTYAFETVAHQLLVSAHHLLLVPLVFVLAPLPLTWENLLVIPALVLYAANGFWIAMTLGMLELRHRDLGNFIAPLLRALFFLTPVFWMPEIVQGARQIVVYMNPLYYFLEIVRAPLLGYAPSATAWIVCVSITAAGIFAMWGMHRWQRRQLTFWL